jgi:hypothetical protein
MFRAFCIALVAVLFVGGSPVVPGAADQDIAADEYTVYSTLLSPENALSKTDTKAGKEERQLAKASRNKRPYLVGLRGDILVVRLQTRSPETLDEKKIQTVESSSLVGRDVKLERELIDDFNAKNKDPHLLSDRFSAARKVVLLSKEESEEIFNKGGWDEFYRSYPKAGGILTLSRVGFNAVRDRAFLYVGSLAGPRAGAGYFVLFQKSKASGTWYVVKHIPLWVS